MSENTFTWMHAGQVGAPQIGAASDSNGQLLQMLDACLINGFSSQTVSTVTKNQNSITLTYGLPHKYEKHQYLTVSGASDAALNGKHRVVAKTETAVTISVTGVNSTSGILSTKISPLGFESIFGSTDPLKRAYRSTDTSTPQTVLYLDMSLPAGHGYSATTPAKRAAISLCEDMTSLGVQINSYTDLKNDYATNPNGVLFWYQNRGRAKIDVSSSPLNSNWVLVGNDRVFYLFHEWQTYNQRGTDSRDFYSFGSGLTLDESIDPHNCMCICSINNNDATNIFYSSNGAQIKGNTSLASGHSGVIIKDVKGLSIAPMVVTNSSAYNESVISGAMPNIDFPNSGYDALIGMPLYSKTGQNIRYLMQGINLVAHNIPDAVNTGILVLDDGLLVKVHAGGVNSLSFGCYLIDMGV